ncbi:hypothetical protein, partial [Candidatus Endomicrobiellum devescovinae]|uniref:hypothetical protein n=1 Tax=Candidatus Endomicrobiellum devescovinae TaxID=3242322 RepID=UPI0028359EC7|nr:hypothetical protein [Endomicrobium sp.]
MKKKVIFLCLSVLLCTSTLAFGLDRVSQLINILSTERMQTNQKTPLFSLTFYNLYRNPEVTAKYYIQNPREKLKDILKKLKPSEREELIRKEAFDKVLAAIRHDTDNGGSPYGDLIRREFVRAQIDLREEGTFTAELKFLKMCAEISRQSSKQENNDSNTKSKRLTNSEYVNILNTAEQEGYAQARADALALLRQEGILELANSGIFINKLEESLSYEAAAKVFEKKAVDTNNNLEERKSFYIQAAEEYSHYGNTQKQNEMLTKKKATQSEIEILMDGISSTQPEADRLAGEGKYEDAIQKLDNALADAKKIGQSISDIVGLEVKRENYKAAKDLAEQIRNAKDLKALGTFSNRINAGLNGHENLKFLVLKREYELKRDELDKRVTALKNPGIRGLLNRNSQEEKDEEIRVAEQLLAISKEELNGLNIEETLAQRQERERGIRSRVISETAEIIRSLKREESKTAEEAIGVAVDRVVLARMIKERAIATQAELERKKESLDIEISQRQGNLNKKVGMERNAAMSALENKEREREGVDKRLKEAKTKASSASKEVRKAESDLSLVGLTVEKVAREISERESFYKDSKNVDGELQAKSSEFPSKVSAFNAAKAKVNTMQKVSLQTEGIKEIYEQAETITNNPSESGNPDSDKPKGTSLPRPKAEELKVEVIEGNRIYVENNKKIEKEIIKVN